jgi:asparagine synthase (glutamine-hydrolysing)
MCGIAGFVDFTKKGTQEDVTTMSGCLQHRGPDGNGVYFTDDRQASIGLGHRRLSIIDLSETANQPMHYNGIHLIFNGEIYNYQEVKNELLKVGHQFHTLSDTEVILHAWAQWGEAGIDKWRGMFAITLYDEAREEVVCIRDRAGVKPFYYSWQNDLFLFGSELKSIASFPRF